MEMVFRRRNNCRKEPWLGNYSLQLESPKNKDDHVSLRVLYPTIQSYKTFKSLKRS